MRNILIYIAILLLVVLGFGAFMQLAARLIHFALVLAVILLVLHFLRGNRSV